MHKSRKELKLQARRALLGRYPAAVGITFVAVCSMLAMLVVLFLGTLLLGGAMMNVMGEDVGAVAMLVGFYLDCILLTLFYAMLFPGISRFYLNICQGRPAGVGDLLWGFRYPGGKFWGIGLRLVAIEFVTTILSVFLTATAFFIDAEYYANLFVVIYNLLWSAGFIYLILTYGLFYFVLADNPGLSMGEALRESRKLMSGNRWRITLLAFSFLGLAFVSYLTMGMGSLWLWPYICCSFCCFYLDLRRAKA